MISTVHLTTQINIQLTMHLSQVKQVHQGVERNVLSCCNIVSSSKIVTSSKSYQAFLGWEKTAW